MPSYAEHPEAFACHLPLAPFVQHPQLPLGELLSAAELQQAFDQHHVDFGKTTHAVFTPAILLWTWLWQCLSEARSCSAAVARTSVLVVALGLSRWSEDTGTYCRARPKLPVALVRQLARTVGQRVEDAAAKAWLWHERHVYLLDGSTATLPDTPELQKAFPQSGAQKPGLGFPLVRFVLLLALATATVQDLAFGPHKGKQTGELALARQLLGRLKPGDVVVADRYFCSYWLVALLLTLGVQVVFRLHHRRHYDFRKGQRLGPKDHIVTWLRPQRPAWMTEAEYAQVAEEIRVRELHVQVTTKGCRTRSLVLATTLLDAVEYPHADISDLYKWRWQAELDLRSLKQTLGMDQLRSTTVAMMERELWMHVLAYNLIRKVQAQAALWAQAHPPQRRTRRGAAKPAPTPRQLSFKGTVIQVMTWWHDNTTGTGVAQQERYEALLASVSRQRVGNRPGRYEPRAVKRRPKEYDRLTVPRAEARARLLANGPGGGGGAGGGQGPRSGPGAAASGGSGKGAGSSRGQRAGRPTGTGRGQP